jgi:hypothetical protein
MSVVTIGIDDENDYHRRIVLRTGGENRINFHQKTGSDRWGFTVRSIHDLMVKIDRAVKTYHSHKKFYNSSIRSQMKINILPKL